MLSKELLEILACPSCKGDLIYDSKNETLTCLQRHCPECGMPIDERGACQSEECGKIADNFVGLVYRIEEDIPIMLIDEAIKIPLNK